MTGEDLFKFSQHLIQQMLGQTNGLGFLKGILFLYFGVRWRELEDGSWQC